MVDTGLYITYVLIGICVIGILGFSVLNIAKNPGGAKSALVGIVGLIAIFGLTYALSDGTDATTTYAKLDITEGTSSRYGIRNLLCVNCCSNRSDSVFRSNSFIQ